MSLEALTRALGAPPPEEIAALDAADLARLADALETARTRQVALAEKAAEDGLRFIPRLVRGPVKKVLFG
jgi:hypothetical protein